MALLLPAGAILAQKKKAEDALRTVQGVVTTVDGTLAVGAEVQLKNTKNLQIRSYVTQKEGTYFFHGLAPDVDFEVKAQYQGRLERGENRQLVRFPQGRQSGSEDREEVGRRSLRSSSRRSVMRFSTPRSVGQ